MIENSLSKSAQKLRKKKKKTQSSNPIDYTPIKHDLPKYTVIGNVNSRGTKYKVIEIIEAQDEKLANSIFKERAKKSLGGVRNITKVRVELFKEGDVASKEEIIENLPIVEKQKSEVEIIDEALLMLDKIKENMPEIKREFLKRVIESDTLALLKVSLKDRNTQKSALTAYKIVLMPRLNELAIKRFRVDDFYSLSNTDQARIIFDDIIKNEMRYIFDVYDHKIHIIEAMKLDYNSNRFSNKEISSIINTLEGEDTATKITANNILVQLLNEKGGRH